jgi:tetratricopeptide (TPR) repeat protein
VAGLKYLLLHNRALMRSQLDRLDDAAAGYRDAIRLDATRYEAFAGLAQVLHRQGRWDEAVEQLSRAILRNPDYAPLYRERSRVRRERDEPTPEQRLAALHDLDLAIAHEPPGSPILASDQTERGKLLHGLDRPEAALAACDAALAVVPDHAEAHRLRVLVLLELKRYDEVLRSCDGALARGKPRPEILAIRGQARAARHDYSGAVADYSQALALRPGDPAVLNARGLAYLVSNAPELALHDFDEVLRRDPADAEAHGGRGQVLVRLGDHRAAVLAAEESLRHGPQDARRAYNAARVYAEAARLAAAETTGPAPGPLKVALVDRYQQRAVALVQRALERTPPERRAAFWQNPIRTDPVLRPLQRRLRLALPSQAAPDAVSSGDETSSREAP